MTLQWRVAKCKSAYEDHSFIIANLFHVRGNLYKKNSNRLKQTSWLPAKFIDENQPSDFGTDKYEKDQMLGVVSCEKWISP